MSEPQQPPVPPYGQPQQPAPAPQQAPFTQPYQGTANYGQAPQHYPQPTGYPAYAPRPADSGATLGRSALIIALIVLGLSLVTFFILPLIYNTIGFGFWAFDLLGGVADVIVLLGSVAALVLGLIALRRPGSPILAGLAVGIAASQIARTVASWVSDLFYSVL